MPRTTREDMIEHYQHLIHQDPENAAAHHHLAMFYMQQKDYMNSLHHFHRALHAAPTFLEAHYHLGLLFLTYQKNTQAQQQFEYVMALDPQHLAAAFYLGGLHLQNDELMQAEHYFLHVLTLQPEHVPSLINLGALALKRSEGQLAVHYFTQALAFDEHNVDARHNLAATFMHHDRFENALTHYEELQRDDPHNIEYLYNMGVAHMALNHFPHATEYFEKILVQNNSHLSALNNLAAIKIRLSQRDEAILLLQRALDTHPGDSASQFMLHALTGHEKSPQASQDYVRNLFNNYALHYEEHLQRVLKYTLPEQIQRLLSAHGRNTFAHTLDAGCGTGLSGVTLRACSEHLTGIDIAEKMIAHAHKKNIYDALYTADLITHLNENTKKYTLIQAVDVMPYLGDLDEIMQIISLRLLEDGLFVFSTEISHDDPWHVQDNMRFCHHPDYIHGLLKKHDLVLIKQQKMVARQEHDRDVCVFVYIGSRPNELLY